MFYFHLIHIFINFKIKFLSILIFIGEVIKSISLAMDDFWSEGNLANILTMDENAQCFKKQITDKKKYRARKKN